MEKKANNKKKELLTVVLVFAVVLAVTATTWCTQSDSTQSYESPKATLSPGATFKVPDPPKPITCTEDTGHFKTGCELLLHYDYDKGGGLSDAEVDLAEYDRNAGKITVKEFHFVLMARSRGRHYDEPISVFCPGCIHSD